MSVVSEVYTMDKKKGRPSRHRPQQPVKIDTDLLAKARWLLSLEANPSTLADFVSDMLRPVVEKQHKTASKKMLDAKED